MKPSQNNKIWIGSREISEKLELSIATFRRSLDRLTERDGFPLPSPHRLKPMTWRRQAVEDWIETQGYPSSAMSGIPADSDIGGNVHRLRMAKVG